MRGSPRHGGGGSGGGTLPGASPACERSEQRDREAVSMLDIPTPQDDTDGAPSLGIYSQSARRLYNRALLGMMKEGRYYFCTWTTTPDGMSISEYWPKLRRWLKIYRPKSSWCYCLTKEGRGKGVCHLVIRIGEGEHRLEVEDLRNQWKALTGARQIRIERVKSKEQLSQYMSDQRQRKRMAKELLNQSDLIRWRWSQGWLPKGFTREYGKFFWRYAETPKEEREKALKIWLRQCFNDGEMIFEPPQLSSPRISATFKYAHR